MHFLTGADLLFPAAPFGQTIGTKVPEACPLATPAVGHSKGQQRAGKVQ